MVRIYATNDSEIEKMLNLDMLLALFSPNAESAQALKGVGDASGHPSSSEGIVSDHSLHCNQFRKNMKITKCKLAIASVLLTLMSINMNVKAKEISIEWAPFIKAPDVVDEQLIAKADVVTSDFLIIQKGFIKRELLKKDDNEYADVIYWETKSDAITAGEKVNTCIKCGEYFGLMKMGEKAGEGFSHYTVIKSWKR